MNKHTILSVGDYNRMTYSYLALRKTVGWIGLLLPFILMLGGFLLDGKIQQSISHYYYSSMGNVLVGAMCSVALFLFFYCGYDKWDHWAGNIAGFFALGVALFPTTEVGDLTITGKIHYICATLFFLTLAFFSIFLFTKLGPNPTQEKIHRNKIYRICGFIMIACMIGIVIFTGFFQNDNSNSCFVFWAETIALISFGISWLTKGGTICPD